MSNATFGEPIKLRVAHVAEARVRDDGTGCAYACAHYKPAAGPRHDAKQECSLFRKLLPGGAPRLPECIAAESAHSAATTIDSLRAELATVLSERDAAVSMGAQLERERDGLREQLREADERIRNCSALNAELNAELGKL